MRNLLEMGYLFKRWSYEGRQNKVEHRKNRSILSGAGGKTKIQRNYQKRDNKNGDNIICAVLVSRASYNWTR